MIDGFQEHQGNKGWKMEKMRQGLWRNVLRFLVKVSHIDLNEELLNENEYLKAEIDVYRKQLERLGKRPRFTDVTIPPRILPLSAE